jgi:hypothetical protein
MLSPPVIWVVGCLIYFWAADPRCSRPELPEFDASNRTAFGFRTVTAGSWAVATGIACGLLVIESFAAQRFAVETVVAVAAT